MKNVSLLLLSLWSVSVVFAQSTSINLYDGTTTGGAYEQEVVVNQVQEVKNTHPLTAYGYLEAGYDHVAWYQTTDIPQLVNGNIPNSGMNGFHVDFLIMMDYKLGKNAIGAGFGLGYQYVAAEGFCMKDYAATKKQWLNDAKKSGYTKAKYLNKTEQQTLWFPIRIQYSYLFDPCALVLFTGPKPILHVRHDVKGEYTYYSGGKKQGTYANVGYMEGKGSLSTWVNDVETKASVKVPKDSRYPLFDMSWSFGVGFRWKQVQFNLSYDLGMINYLTDETKKTIEAYGSGYKFKRRDDVLSLSVGVLFR